MSTIPVNGKADWVDYTDYWREADAEWLMERTVLKYADATARTTEYAVPKFGMTTYNEALDRLEVYSKTSAAWATVQQFVNLKTTQDSAAGVALSHNLAANKGIIFEPTRTVLNNPIYVMSGVLFVDDNSVDIKTGTATAKLTTTPTHLASDLPISASAFAATGAITAATATLTGALTAPNIVMSGTLSGNGILNGTSGTIGSIALASSIISISTVGSASANAAGFQQGQGYFYGDANSAVMRQRPTSASAAGTAYAQVTSADVNLSGTLVNFVGQPKVLSNRSMQYATTAGTFNGGPVIVQTVDPGVGNVPEGTIWINA